MVLRIFRIKKQHLTRINNLGCIPKCFKCGEEMNLNDICASKSPNGKFNLKWYHEGCAKMVNII